MGLYPEITSAPEGIKQNRWLSFDTSNEQHHSMKCISSSQLKFLASGKSLENFYQKYILRSYTQTFDEAYRIGTIAHLAVLEPKVFEECVFECDLDQRTTEYKEHRLTLAGVSQQPTNEFDEKLKKLEEELELADSKEQTKVIKDKIKKLKKDPPKVSEGELKFTKNGGFLNAQGKEVFLVKAEEMKMYRAFQKQFEKHPRLSVLIDECHIEQSGVAQDPETELWMSIRGDARCDRGFFIDPKTIGDELSSQTIERYVAQYHLPIQAAHYLEVANLIEQTDKYKKFFFVMMSKKPPFEIALVQLDADSLAWGFDKRRRLLNQISECEKNNKWPSFDCNNNNYGITISMPRWGFT